MGRGECIPQHLHDGLSFDSRSRACPLSLPSSLLFPRLHHLFEPMPHVTLLWSSEIYCVPKLLKFCVSWYPHGVTLTCQLQCADSVDYTTKIWPATEDDFKWLWRCSLFSSVYCVRFVCWCLFQCVLCSFPFFPLLFFLRVVTLILSTFLCEICQCVHPVACVLCLRAPCCTPYTLLQTGPCK